MQITVRYFAAARAAAGTEHALVEIDEGTTLGDLERILGSGNPDLGHVLARCSYLRDEVALCDRDRTLGHCTTIDVLPPFAGG